MLKNDALIELYDKMHEMEMDRDNPSEAVAGRCLKRFYEPFDEFEREEIHRVQHHGIVAFGILRAASMIVGATVLTGAKPGCEDKIISHSIEVFADTLRGMASAKHKGMEGENR